MKRIISGFLSVLAASMMLGSVVSADVSAIIVGTCTNETDISVYVKDAGDTAQDPEVQIATAKAEQVQVQRISELEVPVRTLVMLDNSLSIPEKDRDKIADCLQSIISDRITNEEICIAVFGEELNVLADYSNDYATLKRAIDSISYQDQETYLTDVLYDVITAEYGNSDIYSRIIIISDGIDNKEMGYTKEELYLLLQNAGIPICTIGCTTKNNSEELENMFALSRLTSTASFLLSDVEDILDITAVLKEDRDILKFTITPPADLMDGSRKTVKIAFSDNTSVSAEITMPQQVVEKQPEEPSEEPEPAKKTEEPEEPVIAEIQEEERGFPYLGVILAGAILIIAVMILVIVLVIRKKKNNSVKFESIDESLLNSIPPKTGPRLSEEKSDVHTSDIRNNGDDGTIMIWDQTVNHQLILTDIHNPKRYYQIPLNKPVIVGRNKEKCDIVLDYERSVSGRHCEIRERAGRYYVNDLQSANGTFLNGSRVLFETEIVPGSILKLGRIELRFDIR